MNPKPISSKSKKSKARPDSSKATAASKPPLPTAFELSQIAALLSGKSLPQDASELARRSFQLWEACGQELVEERLLRAIQEGAIEVLTVRARGVPGEMPKSWPCSFDEALRLVMPKKRTRGERYAPFRLFLRDLVKTGKAPSEEETLNKIEDAIKAFKQQGFKNFGEYHSWLEPFSVWLSDHDWQAKSGQRRKAAKARWDKKHVTQGENQSS